MLDDEKKTLEFPPSTKRKRTEKRLKGVQQPIIIKNQQKEKK